MDVIHEADFECNTDMDGKPVQSIAIVAITISVRFS